MLLSPLCTIMADGDSPVRHSPVSQSPVSNSAVSQSPDQAVIGSEPQPEESSPPSGGIRKKQRVNGDKTCRVCGDKALAHNFDVISCESCKAFFRRNALKTKMKGCAFSGNCEITTETRRFCPHCRLKKCLECGMKPDMILGTDERKARLEKMAENRLKRQQKEQQQQQWQQQPATGTSCLVNPSTPDWRSRPRSGSGSGSEEQPEQMEVPDLDHSTINLSDLGHSIINCSGLGFVADNGMRFTVQDGGNPDFEDTAFSEIFLKPDLGSADDLGQTDVTFEHIPRDKLPSDPHMYWHLTDEERALLADITTAYQDTILRLPDVKKCCPCKHTVCDVMARCSRYPKDIVDFFKRLKDFRSLRVEDRVAAMKGSSFRTFLIKCAASFVLELDAWIKDDGYLTVAQFQEASGEHAFRVQALANFSSSLKHILKSDSTSFALLQCMSMFDPRDANLNDRQQISSLHDKYSLLLKHHLESQFSYLYAPHYLAAVRQKLGEMGHVIQVVQVMFMDWVGILEPLMREVLNLS